MSDPVTALHRARKELLDLSPGNPLLSAPRHAQRASALEILDARSEQIFRMLAREGTRLGFSPGPAQLGAAPDAADDPFADLPPPATDVRYGMEGASAELGASLQTGLAAGKLHGRLLRLHYEARTAYEEQGLSTLFLALGFLEWEEAPPSRHVRRAPLILLPVRLERQDLGGPFTLAMADGEIAANICLVEKLEQDFALELPAPPEPAEFEPAAYLRAWTKALRREPRFIVHPDDVELGLFSFTSFLMYRDLDPVRWPASTPLVERPLIRALLGDGFGSQPGGLPEGTQLDELLSPLETVHVLDADSTQAAAIEEVRRGRNLLIQGPPGSGKSQTIANLIAGAVRDGKKVLFVAEKTAALEAVKQRLDRIDLGAVCLELYGPRSAPRALIADLRRTLELGQPRADDPRSVARELTDLRRRLNEHARLLHTPLEPSGLTPFELIGHLIRLARRGTPRAEVRLPSAPAWTRAEIAERRIQIEALTACVGRIGVPAVHVWRGARRAAPLPENLAWIEEQARQLSRSLEGFAQASEALHAGLSAEPSRNAGELTRLLDTCEYLIEAPTPIDEAALGAACWTTRREEIAALVAAGAALEASGSQLRRIFLPAAWSADIGELRRRLAHHARSRSRFLRPDYWRARGELQRLARAPLPGSIEARIELLDSLREGQEAQRQIERLRHLGAQAFGRLWRGTDSDWAQLARIEQWQGEGEDAQLLSDAPRLLPRIADRSRTGRLTVFTQQLLERITAGCEELFARLDLKLLEAFGHAELSTVPLGLLRERLQAWAARPADLADWIAYHEEASHAEDHGLAALVERLHHGRLPVERAPDVFEAAVFEPLLRHAMRRFPQLAAFDGDTHGHLIARFRELDQARLEITRAEVALAHHDRLPRRTGKSLFERTLAAPEPHLPVRELLASSGGAIQAIKPVFMMSPLSVALHLPPGAVRFDLLVIDEASRMEALNALAAIARADQLVVVGDDGQPPPYQLLTGRRNDVAREEDEPAALRPTRESILALCAARGMPQRGLRWHYRSRHPSLIALSNREFYGGRLCVVPSPFLDTADLGLRFHHVPAGVYERGALRANRIEARAVAEAVLEHARKRPHLSLGVGCLSVEQRDAVLLELEGLWRSEPDARGFFAPDRPEPFFVKSLEHIQGDARDVILASIGYGPDESGHLAQGFGALSAEGGERQLNVLMTRARQRLEVFASIRARDVDPVRPDRPGVAALKAFLQSAESNTLGLAQPSGGGYGSIFEEQVAAALAELGHQVDGSVGVAGLFVGLAIRDPGRASRYLLGIECDGTSYRDAPTARDRDLLRPRILEAQGWIIHRMWCGDWFRRPTQELRRLMTAIEAAREAWQIGDRKVIEPVAASDAAGISRRAAIAAAPPATRPYVEAEITLPDGCEPHLLPMEQMVETLVQIVRSEGPVHRDEVARRLAAAEGAAPSGGDIMEAVSQGLGRALRRSLITREGAFYAPAGLDETPLRDRSAVGTPSLRRPEMLPPAEIRAAALHLARAPFGLAFENAAVEIGRLLGVETTGAPLRATVEPELQRLLNEGALSRTEQGALREGRRSAA